MLALLVVHKLLANWLILVLISYRMLKLQLVTSFLPLAQISRVTTYLGNMNKSGIRRGLGKSPGKV